MILLAVVIALLLEQVRPLAPSNPAAEELQRWASSVASNVDTGNIRHAWLAWVLAVALPAVAVAAVHWLLVWVIGWPLALLWAVFVLYLTLGFRQFSHHFTGIREALELGDDVGACKLLAQWQGVDASTLSRTEIVRMVLEHSVLAAHRHVFGVFAWFCVLAVVGLGPAGAVLYRGADLVMHQWLASVPGAAHPVSVPLRSVAGELWYVIDWLPARLTALSLAIVGSFEDAIDCWRQHANRFPDPNDGIILAAAAGAVGVRFGGAALRPIRAVPGEGSTEPGGVGLGVRTLPGEVPQVAHFARVVGLLWRMVALWLLLLVLLTLAHVLG